MELSFTLRDAELESWRQNHYLVLPNVLSGPTLEALQSWTDELIEWPETPGKWMKYYERTETQRQLCRVENFVPFHPQYAELLCGPSTLEVVSSLMGEAAVLFKEKINLKLAGGAGFRAHQDAPAFDSFGHRYHITAMVAIDDSVLSNGCLEVSDPLDPDVFLPQADDKSLSDEAIEALSWRPVEVNAGSMLFFDSYLPHRSPPNHSGRSRRAVFATYNRASEGDVRDRYFEEKRRVFPPECERDPNVDYSQIRSVFNVGNPIR